MISIRATSFFNELEKSIASQNATFVHSVHTSALARTISAQFSSSFKKVLTIHTNDAWSIIRILDEQYPPTKRTEENRVSSVLRSRLSRLRKISILLVVYARGASDELVKAIREGARGKTKVVVITFNKGRGLNGLLNDDDALVMLPALSDEVRKLTGGCLACLEVASDVGTFGGNSGKAALHDHSAFVRTAAQHLSREAKEGMSAMSILGGGDSVVIDRQTLGILLGENKERTDGLVSDLCERQFAYEEGADVRINRVVCSAFSATNESHRSFLKRYDAQVANESQWSKYMLFNRVHHLAESDGAGALSMVLSFDHIQRVFRLSPVRAVEQFDVVIARFGTFKAADLREFCCTAEEVLDGLRVLRDGIYAAVPWREELMFQLHGRLQRRTGNAAVRRFMRGVVRERGGVRRAVDRKIANDLDW